MATDFYDYANLRLLIPQPVAAPTNFRSGVPPSTASWVIECFVKVDTASGQPPAAKPGQTLPSIDPGARTFSGFITATATLPANTSWLAASSAFTWDTTGLAPSGLIIGLGGQGFLGVLPDLPTITSNGQTGKATIIGIGGTYGPGGIGAELRSQLGDAITVELNTAT